MNHTIGQRATMNVISVSYGNDSCAMIQWAHEQRLPDVHVVYCNTGWASPAWPMRVIKMEAWAKSLGFQAHTVSSIGMPELVRIKKGFPSNAEQFCTGHLKGVPFLQWIDEFDSDCTATVLIGKRRAESRARANTPEFIYGSEYHGGRKVWHPLYLHSDADRNALLARAGIEILPHRSKECSPCVNAKRATFLALTPGEIERVNDLEVEISQPMFRAKRFGALGIHGVMEWARSGRDRGDIEEEEATCAGLFGCGS